jgi:hypothetical protein
MFAQQKPFFAACLARTPHSGRFSYSLIPPNFMPSALARTMDSVCKTDWIAEGDSV